MRFQGAATPLEGTTTTLTIKKITNWRIHGLNWIHGSAANSAQRNGN